MLSGLDARKLLTGRTYPKGMSMQTDQPTPDYDAIIRRAHEMRAEAIHDLARSIAAFFRRRRPARKTLLG